MKNRVIEFRAVDDLSVYAEVNEENYITDVYPEQYKKDLKGAKVLSGIKRGFKLKFKKKQQFVKLTTMRIKRVEKAESIAEYRERFQEVYKAPEPKDPHQVLELFDGGQDAIYWVIDKDGVVITTKPTQGWLWRGSKIFSKIAPNRVLVLYDKYGVKRNIKYPIVKVVKYSKLDQAYEPRIARSLKVESQEA
jgi:hypothetical protein